MALRNDVRNAVVGTLLAELITLPICTIKTNLQTNAAWSLKRTISDIYARGGLASFYSASLPAVVSQVLTTTTKFSLYRELQRLRGTLPRDTKNNVANSVCSGLGASLLAHPWEVGKVLKQRNVSFTNELGLCGPRLFFRGYSKGLAKTLMGATTYFPLYDHFHSCAGAKPWQAAVATSVASTLLIHPLDYLRVRHISGLVLFQGWKPFVYYRGIGSNLARIVPHFAITMTTIDFLHKQ